MKLILSTENLTQVNSHSEGFPTTVRLFDDWNEVNLFLSQTQLEVGISDRKKFLKEHPFYVYTITSSSLRMVDFPSTVKLKGALL